MSNLIINPQQQVQMQTLPATPTATSTATSTETPILSPQVVMGNTEDKTGNDLLQSKEKNTSSSTNNDVKFKKPSYSPFQMKSLKGFGVAIVITIIISLIWGLIMFILYEIGLGSLLKGSGGVAVLATVGFIGIIITILFQFSLYNRWVGCYFKQETTQE